MKTKYKLKTSAIVLTGALIVSSLSIGGADASAATKVTPIKNNTTVKTKGKLLYSAKTNKKLTGYVVYKSKVYKNGSLFTGVLNKTRYKAGNKLTGLAGKYMYKNGVKANGTVGKYAYKKYVYKNGIKVNGKVGKYMYRNGVKANGTLKGYVYKDGIKLTGKRGRLLYEDGRKFNGVKAKKLYVTGILNSGNTYYKNQWYKGATLDTAKNNAIKSYQAAIKTAAASKYTVASWEAFEKVVNQNKYPLDYAGVTTAQWNKAASNINTAKAKLVTLTSEKAVLHVSSLVEKLTETSDAAKIEEARQAYDNLTTQEKNLVSKETVDQLTNLEQAAEAVVVSEDALKVNEDGSLGVYFQLDKELDLSKGAADVKLSYFTVVNGEKVPFVNSLADNTPLVKSKAWDGYLANATGEAKNYSKGTANNEAYSDVIPANQAIGSLVKKGFHANGDMDYVEVTNFNLEPGVYTVEIAVTNAAGVVTTKEITTTVETTVAAVEAKINALTATSSIETITEVDNLLKGLSIEDQATVKVELKQKLTDLKAAAEAVTISEDALKVNEDGSLGVYFQLDKALDLSKGAADVKLSYFTVVNGEKVPFVNSLADNTPLVKSKTWDGYLANAAGEAKNYSKGTANNEAYSDVIPANQAIGSLVKKGYHTNGDMDYVQITNFNETPATYAVDIEIINAAGAATVKTVEYTVLAE